jgi:hypothetical protein
LRKLERLLDAIFLALLVALFSYWLFSGLIAGAPQKLLGVVVAPTTQLTVAAIVMAALVCALFGVLGVFMIGAVFSSWNGQIDIAISDGLGRRSRRLFYRHPWAKLILCVLAARLLVYTAAYILYTSANGYQGGLLDTLPLWLKGDAPHYLGIAENWYVTEGDPRFHIVFFPLYPICVRIFNGMVHHTFASGMALSLLFTVAACVLLYELALLDMDREAAWRAVKYLLLMPAAFLLCAPMSDALFFMLSLACMLAARKKRYALACALGGFAAFTRVLGVLLLAPVLIEMGGDIARVKLAGDTVAGRFTRRTLPLLLLIPAGLLLYIYINYRVTGNAFQFMVYQSEHWSQNMGLFFNTAAYQTNNFLNNIHINPAVAYGLWLPNLVFLVGAPAVVLLGQRPNRRKRAVFAHSPVGEPLRQPYGMRASYIAFFLAYYLTGMGTTWLLSAPRYLTCCFVLLLALASKERSRLANAFIYILLMTTQFLYLAAYVAGWPVY